MTTWRTTAITLPRAIEDADLPADLTTLVGFPANAPDVAISIEPGGSVNLQRVNAAGAWETFETATEAADFVIVVNHPAIRFEPVEGCDFLVRWEW